MTGKRAILVAALLLVAICAGMSVGMAEGDKAGVRLKAVLAEYDKARKATREIRYDYTCTEEDRTFNTKEIATGQVLYRKPDMVRIDRKAKGHTEHYLLENRKFHMFLSARKTEQIFPLSEEFGFPEHPEQYPKEKGWFMNLFPSTGSILEVFAMLYLQLPTSSLEKDCTLRLKKEDEKWIVLEIKPRTPRFKRNFQQMEVVLNAKTYQLKRLWLEQANDSTIRIDVENSVINPKEPLTEETIRQGLPQGWEQLMIPPVQKAN